MLRVLVTEVRPDRRALWAAALTGVRGIQVQGTHILALAAQPDLDALVLPLALARDWYGADDTAPAPLVLSTSRYHGQGRTAPTMPPWVVAMDLYPARAPRTLADSAEAESLAGNWAYAVFTAVFQCIQAFNAQAEPQRIQIIAIDSWSVNVPRRFVRVQALALRRAYLELFPADVPSGLPD